MRHVQNADGTWRYPSGRELELPADADPLVVDHLGDIRGPLSALDPEERELFWSGAWSVYDATLQRG